MFELLSMLTLESTDQGLAAQLETAPRQHHQEPVQKNESIDPDAIGNIEIQDCNAQGTERSADKAIDHDV